MSKRAVLLIALTLMQGLAKADDGKCARDFKNAGVELIEKAQANGWDLESQIPLEKIKLDMKEILVECLSDEITSVNKGRKSAFFYNVKNQKYIGVMQDGRQGISAITSLHEHLGALDYDDEYGQISSVVAVMAKKVPKVSPELKNISATQNSRSGGTSTGVSGGGDNLLLDLKSLFLEKFLAEMASSLNERQQSELIERFSRISIVFFNKNKVDDAPILSYARRTNLPSANYYGFGGKVIMSDGRKSIEIDNRYCQQITFHVGRNYLQSAEHISSFYLLMKDSLNNEGDYGCL